jgi:hypothetical protein
MPTVRVMLLHMPQILREIFEHEIDRQPDLELVPERRSIPRIDDRRGPDVVIVGTRVASDTRTPRAVLARWPRARVMTVTPSEGEAVVCELRLHTTTLGQVSPADIVRSIREVEAPALRLARAEHRSMPRDLS